MTAPLLAAACFEAGSPDYPRLARVLAYTAAQHCPAWRRLVETAPPPPAGHAAPTFIVNTHKMTRWCAILEAAADGDRICFVDVDTFVVRALDPLWDLPFDLAYTVRPTPTYPFNTGVVAVRVSPALRAFFARWHAETLRMLAEPAHHHPFRRKYGGIHQAALGRLFEEQAHRDLAVAKLPCREWNCEDSSWAHFDPAVTRIVHVKSSLRRASLLHLHSGGRMTQPLAKRWQALEREAVAAEGCA